MINNILTRSLVKTLVNYFGLSLKNVKSVEEVYLNSIANTLLIKNNLILTYLSEDNLQSILSQLSNDFLKLRLLAKSDSNTFIRLKLRPLENNHLNNNIWGLINDIHTDNAYVEVTYNRIIDMLGKNSRIFSELAQYYMASNLIITIFHPNENNLYVVLDNKENSENDLDYYIHNYETYYISTNNENCNNRFLCSPIILKEHPTIESILLAY